MRMAKRILIVSHLTHNPVKMFLDQTHKLAKGFIRSGHDVNVFNYHSALLQTSPFKSKRISSFFKTRVDDMLALHAKSYSPGIVFICFPRVFDANSVGYIRQAAPNAVFVGLDGDPWPEMHKNRIEVAKTLDVLFATNDGDFLQVYRDAGVPLCVFMPNACDPDVEYRYQAPDKWKCDILFTGQIKHKHHPTEDLRSQIVNKLAGMSNCAIYGCCGRPQVGGIDYLYAISGARIGFSMNAINSVRLYHSDRFTHYLGCGTFVLAKRVPDTDLLFQDGVHLRYFDTADEFFDMAKWYLSHEGERIKIADAGMQRAHTEFNCEKIAQYILDIIETGSCDAPWAQVL